MQLASGTQRSQRPSVRLYASAEMVNYKRVVCEVAVLAVLAAVATAAPADCREGEAHYDQRQNGTENYRLNIDGVVIAVAPADSLLAAASDIDFNDLFDLEELSELQKPKPPADEKPPKPQSPATEPKPDDTKPEEPAKPEALSDVSLNSDVKGQKKDASTRKQEKTQRLKNRLAHILMPLLRRTRHH